jgi:hypothetical protein
LVFEHVLMSLAASVTVDWFHVVLLLPGPSLMFGNLRSDRQSFRITPAYQYSKTRIRNVRKTKRMPFWNWLNRALLPPRPTESKNCYAGFLGPNQSRLHVAHYSFSQAYNRVYADCPLLEPVRNALASFERHMQRLLHCSLMQGSKALTACSNRQGPGLEATET